MILMTNLLWCVSARDGNAGILSVLCHVLCSHANSKKMLRNSHPVVSTVLFIKIWKKKDWMVSRAIKTDAAAASCAGNARQQIQDRSSGDWRMYWAPTIRGTCWPRLLVRVKPNFQAASGGKIDFSNLFCSRLLGLLNSSTTLSNTGCVGHGRVDTVQKFMNFSSMKNAN
jgi:hypothetical protein